ncbi:VC0807 family protein [Streptomyces sp. NPDC048182]|uniref:VC0807 family protein n=1 Tax=Streptomyces sp. NPDC048182 TaxID=3365507 RepID=UPI00371327EA
MTKTTGNTGNTASTGNERAAFRTLLVDVGVPVASYYLLKSAAGLSTVAALGWSSVVPVLRLVWGMRRQREVNALPLLILAANLLGVLVGFGTGDARLMLVKDSAIGSLVGIAMLGSVLLGRPLMSGAVKPFLVKGDPGREAAWERLRRESGAFRRVELRFSAVWGSAFVVECGLRIVGAYTVPVDTMVWLGTVVMLAVMGMAFLVSGAVGAVPMAQLLGAPAPLPAVRMAEGERDSSLAGSTHR